MCIACICIMVRGRIKGYRQCYKSFVTWLTTQLCSNQSGHKLCVKPSKKHKQGAAYSSTVHPLAVFHTQASGSVSVSNSNYTNFHQPSLRSVKLHSNFAQQTIISKPYTCDVCRESERKEDYTSWNGKFIPAMETQGFPSANSPAPFRSTGPAV